MAQINISDDVLNRVMAFKPVVESVFEVQLEENSYIELLLRLAPDLLLNEFLGGADGRALLGLLQQMGQAQPAVFGLLANVLELDEHKMMEAQQRAIMRQRLGFPEPETKNEGTH